MNHREFIKFLLAASAIIALEDVDTILEKTNHLSDHDFVTYIMFQMRLMVDNPAHCAIITSA